MGGQEPVGKIGSTKIPATLNAYNWKVIVQGKQNLKEAGSDLVFKKLLLPKNNDYLLDLYLLAYNVLMLNIL